MRYAIALLACLCLFGSSALAESVRLPAGTASYTITNDPAFKLNSDMIAYVWFRVPAGITNAFTMTHYQDKYTYSYAGDTVTTNYFGGVETNTFHTVTNKAMVTFTNVLLSATTTNAASHMYRDEVDFYTPLLKAYDRLTFTWSYTNSPIDFIIEYRVAD